MRSFEEVQRELRESIGHAYRDEAEDIQQFGGNIEHLDKATHLLNELVEIHNKSGDKSECLEKVREKVLNYEAPHGYIDISIRSFNDIIDKGKEGSL